MKFRSEAEGGKLKPANFEQEYTPQQLIELARCMSDPIHFIETYCMVIHPSRGRIPFKLYDYQKRMIYGYEDCNRIITMAPRQTGKSTVAAAYLLWNACFKPDQHILIASNLQRGSTEIMTRMRFMYEELPWFLKPGYIVMNVNSMKFDNNSLLEGVATTENTGRGLSVTALYLDEFSKVRPTIQQGFYASTLPTLSTGGRLIITSTPGTDEDRFATIWFSAQDYDRAYAWSDEAAGKIGAKPIVDTYETVFEEGAPEIEGITAPILNVEGAADYGFKRMFVHWKEHPDRDENYKRRIMAAGFPDAQWLCEYECLGGLNAVTIRDNGVIKRITLAQLEKMMS